ncbi:rhodanese-like domain-containing protein [Roseospira navarrensis]|uniref:Rhodanese-like domain-containing protein n=2 Tax=Roseospira navarrensis TaxID=140058 RepID=A0A7X1ZH01_9PROT|nr:rhodanese-like domain-containing protein [Roseospira navarrensis]
MRERVHIVDPATAQAWHAAGEAVIVDVREMYEYAQAHIPGAVPVPLSAFDPGQVPAPPDGGRLVLHCAVGVRCEYAAMALVSEGHPGPIYRIEGGITAWGQSGGPLEAGSWHGGHPPVGSP